MPMSRAQREALLRKYEKLISEAYGRTVHIARNRANIKALEAAIIAGDIDAILAAAGVRVGMWSTMNEQIRGAYVESGTLVLGGDLPRGVDLDFDITNPRAESWLRENSSKLVQGLKQEQEKAVQVILREGMIRGDGPGKTALDIAGRIGPTGRRTGGVLGLTREQAQFVANMADDLETLNPRYFTRKLRDKRFDSAVRKAMRTGRPLPQATRDKIVARYSDRWLKHRGETIARTETLQAINASSQEALQQIVEQGLAPEHAVIRIWRHSYSKNEREGHVMMSGQRRGMNEPFVNPITLVSLPYPGAGPGSETINCRCYVEHEIDFIAAAKARAA